MRPTIPSTWTRGLRIVASMAFAAGFAAAAKDPSPRFSPIQPGVEYARDDRADVPWSIHLVRVDRADTNLVFHSAHAGGRAVGLATLSEIVGSSGAALGTPVAALNGDFYRRDHAFAGDPRGLQISDGELLSAPSGGVGFWIDHEGKPHAGPLESGLLVKWPDGTKTPVGLNGERADDAAELYTPKAGRSTRTPDGREWVLEVQGPPARGILPSGTNLTLVVREIRDGGNSPILPGTLVLSVDSSLVGRLPKPGPGAVLTLSTATRPDLGGARMAIGGGPVLVREGRPQPIVPVGGGYSSRSMTERHPRSAIGWDSRYFYLVEVDGRQPDLSVGMTLAELAAYLARLGCVEAMNLDGGGSATLWAGGEVRNSPCDGRERPIANALVVVRQARR